MNRNGLKKLFNDNFKLYQKCLKRENFDICNEIYQIAQSQNNSIATQFCFTLSHVIVACTQAPNSNYNIIDVMYDYYDVMQSHLYEDYIMTMEDWATLCSKIKAIYAKYQTKDVSNLGIEIINLYEREQNIIQLKKLQKEVNKNSVEAA